MQKRWLCLLTTLVLVLGMLGSFSATAATVPTTAMVVNQSWTSSNCPTGYTFNGVTFSLKFGTNAFATVTDAINAATSGGTIVVTAGTYSETVNITKSLTIVGAKNGINPNVKGSTTYTAWTLNSNRGTDETIFTGAVNLGVSSTGVYSAATNITIDGIMLRYGGQLRSNNGKAGSCTIKLNNIYIKNSDRSNAPIYLEPYYGGANLYKRYVTIQNLRVEGQKRCSLMRLNAESAYIAGVFMSSNCTAAFFDHVSCASDSTAAVEWTVRDSMFANPVHRNVYFDTDTTNTKSNGIKLKEKLANRTSVTSNLKNCVFLNANPSTTDSTTFSVAFRPNTTNAYFNFAGNSFYYTTAPGTNYVPICGYAADTTKNYGSKVIVYNNRFIGVDNKAYTFYNAGDNCKLNGNYHERSNGTVKAVGVGGPNTQSYWFLNRELTARSDGATVNVASNLLLNLDNDVKFLGRTYTNNGIRYFNWTNGGFEFNFKGTGAACTLHSNNATGSNTVYLYVYIDGVYSKTVTLSTYKTSVVLATKLSDTTHTVRLVKRTNGRSSTAGVSRIWLEKGGTILQENAPSSRKMQFLGDSITVGYGSLNPNGYTSWSTSTEDGTITYAALTAKHFSADNHTIAISGRGIVKNYGGDTTDYAPALYEYTDWRNHTQWNHKNYVPDVIVINYGTNDKSAGVTASEFKAGCKAFIKQVRADNPTSIIIYAYGFMGNSYASQVSAAVSELNASGDKKIYYLALSPITAAEKSIGHPNGSAHQLRAQTLINKVAAVTGWTQETSHTYSSSTDTSGRQIKICSTCGKTVTVF